MRSNKPWAVPGLSQWQWRASAMKVREPRLAPERLSPDSWPDPPTTTKEVRGVSEQQEAQTGVAVVGEGESGGREVAVFEVDIVEAGLGHSIGDADVDGRLVACAYKPSTYRARLVLSPLLPSHAGYSWYQSSGKMRPCSCSLGWPW